MPEKEHDIDAAKHETTARTSRFKEMRKGRRGLVTYVKEERADDFKAVCAAKGQGVEERLEELVLKDTEANEDLIAIGKEKLKKPRRYRSRVAADLKEENLQLKRRLRASGLKP